MYKTAAVFQSTKSGKEMLKTEKALKFARDVQTENQIINICPEFQYQEILGFGGAFTETSAYNYSKLSAKNKKKVIEAYFDREKGLGYNFCRTHIHSCDFSLDEYTYTKENDKALKTFSIKRDRKYTIPFIKAAQQAAGNELLLFASPWSPPAWMKDNNDFCHGGRLLPEFAQCWADYMARYIKEYHKEGIDFFGMSVQNEAKAWQTWESCEYSAEAEGLFVRDNLKPALKKAGFGDIKILIWDHNKERVYDRARDTFKVKGAADDIWGIAFHWYSGDHFEALDMAHEAFPDKPLILSEFCLGGSRGERAKGPHSSWDGVEIYAKEIISDFNHFMAASVDWNMIVDEDGGPFHDRPAGCKAQIVVDHEAGTVSLEPTYYTVAHFSRFVKRGAVRIGSSSFSETLKTVAFRNPDGEIVVVALNCAQKKTDAYLRLNDNTTKTTLPAHSLTTFVIGTK